MILFGLLIGHSSSCSGLANLPAVIPQSISWARKAPLPRRQAPRQAGKLPVRPGAQP